VPAGGASDADGFPKAAGFVMPLSGASGA